ncbi:hypothetical protein OF83DRAFT_87520 [Amylostereum chailletii]|nr:hypothetical protein OF83DRAFT_87520 [Amylostereum chailletii]
MVTSSQLQHCACGKPLPPSSDYYCSRDCAMEDTCRALFAHDSFYRRQVYVVEASALPSARGLRRRAAFHGPLHATVDATRARTSSTVAVPSLYNEAVVNPEKIEDCQTNLKMLKVGHVGRRRYYKNIGVLAIRGHNGVFSRAKGLGKSVVGAMNRRKDLRDGSLDGAESEAILPPAPWVDRQHKVFNPATGVLKYGLDVLPSSPSMSSLSSVETVNPQALSSIMGAFEPLSVVSSSCHSPSVKEVRRSRSFSGWGTEKDMEDVWELEEVVEERTKMWVGDQD